MTQVIMMVWSFTQSQTSLSAKSSGLRKHHYKQSEWRWWNSSWGIPNPKRWCYESATLNMPANLENSAVATRLEKVSFHSNAKECPNYYTIALISHASKVMPKILQASFNSTWTVNFQMFMLVLEKAEESDQTVNICWLIRKARAFLKNIYFCFID